MFLENIIDLNLQQKIDIKISATDILDLMLVSRSICDVDLETLRDHEIVCNLSSHTPMVFTAIEGGIYIRKTPGKKFYFCNVDSVPRLTRHRSSLLPWISRETSHTLER